MRSAWLALTLLGLACAPRPEQSEERRANVSDPPEPPPHYHDYPEIAPDELAVADAGATERKVADIDPGDCPMSEPPPAPKTTQRIRSGPPVTNYIPPEIIMRPIRARAACFRGCYRAGLARNPSLNGRIVTRFVIDIDGWVRRARLVENELADADVAECVRRSFVGLAYQSPEGGEVTVVYPLQFSP